MIGSLPRSRDPSQFGISRFCDDQGPVVVALMSRLVTQATSNGRTPAASSTSSGSTNGSGNEHPPRGVIRGCCGHERLLGLFSGSLNAAKTRSVSYCRITTARTDEKGFQDHEHAFTAWTSPKSIFYCPSSRPLGVAVRDLVLSGKFPSEITTAAKRSRFVCPTCQSAVNLPKQGFGHPRFTSSCQFPQVCKTGIGHEAWASRHRPTPTAPGLHPSAVSSGIADL